MNASITVAIPSYNKEKYIERCIKSVIHEKNNINTILLIDNNSTDSTLTIAKKFEPVVTCIKNTVNLGMSGNWNKCIDICKDEWLLILHADDELLPNAISHYKNAIKKYPTAGIIYTNAYSIIEDDVSTKTINKSNQKEFWKAGIEAMNCKPTICSAVLVKKEAYTKLGYFIDKSLSSDVEMWHRISSTYDTVFINTPTAIYYVSKSSTGFESLINRDIKDIKSDWDILNSQMASHYPTESLRNNFLNDCFKRAPGSYFAVAKANIRAGNYIKVIQVFSLIIFTYKGLFPLLSMVFKILIKYIKKNL
ncbi:MAG: glycosyltransferase [Candidatus Pacebacteria bacterium]|nr:glycosyltransferase [Candidatus Paceibacterota bacterium]